jgi:hypothetical protein
VDCWLLAVQYVCLVLNHLASSTLTWIPPFQALTSQTQVISDLLVCAFWEPVYYNPQSDGFPSHRNEELGHWAGVATHVGGARKFKILSPQQKVIYRLIIWSALDPKLRHKRLAPLGGEVSHAANTLFVRSKLDKANTDEPSVPRCMATKDPKDLLGCTFLKDSESDGQHFRARIVRAILEHDADMKRDPQHVKFLCEVEGDTADEIYTYNQVLDLIERDNLDMDSDMEQLYRF